MLFFTLKYCGNKVLRIILKKSHCLIIPIIGTILQLSAPVIKWNIICTRIGYISYIIYCTSVFIIYKIILILMQLVFQRPGICSELSVTVL